MNSARIALIGLFCVVALAFSYAVSQAVDGPSRELIPVIDLDDLPPVEDPPPSLPPTGGAEVRPSPTVGPTAPPAATSPPPTVGPTAPPATTSPPPPVDGDDGDDDDDDDGDDDDDDDDDDD